MFKIKFNFSRLYETVISAYSSLDSSEPNEINISTNEIKEIAIDFKEKYFKILKDVDNYHQTIFCDHINGREITKQYFKKIVLFWAKFEIIAKNITHNNSFISSILDVMQLVNSIQKLTPY